MKIGKQKFLFILFLLLYLTLSLINSSPSKESSQEDKTKKDHLNEEQAQTEINISEIIIFTLAAEILVKNEQIKEQLIYIYLANSQLDLEKISIKNSPLKEENPMWKEKFKSASSEAILRTFEKVFDNPIGAFIVGWIDGWKEI